MDQVFKDVTDSGSTPSPAVSSTEASPAEPAAQAAPAPAVEAEVAAALAGDSAALHAALAPAVRDALAPSDADALQRELDEALGGQNLSELMDAAEQSQFRAEQAEAAEAGPGKDEAQRVELSVVRGRIASIRGEDVMIEMHGLGGKNQGVLPLKQFDRPPRVGAIMDFVTRGYNQAEGIYILSREGAVGAATWDQMKKGDLVDARVVGQNKGGLELELVGGIRGFMPASQIDMNRVDDMATYMGQRLTCMVQEVNRKSKSVVLSRRQHLEVERARKELELWAKIELGSVVTGKVTRMAEYGAFVDIGGVDGLLHVSDMSYARVDKPETVVKVGDEIQVKVLKLDKEKKRISLGLKQTLPDPWDSLPTRLNAGARVEGRVVRVVEFGAFVEIEAGVEGLLPVSEMGWNRVRHPNDVVKEGDHIALQVLKLEPEHRKLTLSLKQASVDPWMGAERKYAENSVVDATVKKIAEFGAFVELEPGVEGLVHISELADRRVDTVESILKPGMKEKFRVLEISEDTRKVRLSLKQVKNPKPAEKAQDEKGPSQGQGRGQGHGQGHGHGDRGGGGNFGPKSSKPAPVSGPSSASKKSATGTGGLGSGGGMGMGLGSLKLPS